MDDVELKPKWQAYLNEAVSQMLGTTAMRRHLSDEHYRDTPARVVKAFEEYFWGIDKDPAAELKTSFGEKEYSQMVAVAHVEFVSYCAHHLVPFMGKYTFAYIPNSHVVGLSKIPRMVQVLCARPQVQEALSQQIVTTFQSKVSPIGCGVVMDAFHCCMSCRGVRTWATTRTTALAGVFLSDPAVKAEFLSLVGPAKELGL